MIDVLLGIQWGDEGKGKIVDYLANNYDIIARFNGGGNAGHTLYIGDEKVVLHTIPSGAFNEKCLNLIGNGVVVDPVELFKEIDKILPLCPDILDRLFISEKSHLILPTHRMLDSAYEYAKGDSKIGSTLKGIGPSYMDKTGRNGIRVGDILSDDFKNKLDSLTATHINTILNCRGNLYEFNYDELELKNKEFLEAIERFKSLKIVNGEYWLNKQIDDYKSILAEGAQGTMLDVDFGTYPYVTSSNTISGAVCAGLGVSPTKIGIIYGVTKAYCTRVGNGSFPTELLDNTGDELRRVGSEFGATTGRPRRCGWIDLVALKYTIMINGISKLIITKADILDDFEIINMCVAYDVNGVKITEMPFNLSNAKPVYKELPGWSKPVNNCESYNELPKEFIEYLEYLKVYLDITIEFVSNGAGRDQLIYVNY